jgi:putative sterol carrier protein
MAASKMTVEEFQAMVKGRSDEEILAGVKGEEDSLLAGLFDGMKEAFDPAAASGQTAVIQYDIETPLGKRSFQIKVDNGVCTIMKEGAEKARVTLAMNLPNFVRMMATELDGMQAYMTGKLKIAGDIMFSQNLSRWFKPKGKGETA